MISTFDDIVEHMGQIVTVHAQYRRIRESQQQGGYRVHWRAVACKPRAGWISGKRTLQIGMVHFPRSRWVDDYMPTFVPTNTVEALTVVYWPNLNPVYVPFRGVEPGGEPFPTTYSWPEWSREIHSEEMKIWPRDERGHWKAKHDWTEEDIEQYEKDRTEADRRINEIIRGGY